MSGRVRRLRAEEIVRLALEHSWDEGYGDCPHNGGPNECSMCDAHWVIDALVKEGVVDVIDGPENGGIPGTTERDGNRPNTTGAE